MLIDAYLPVYDVSERHSVLIQASPQRSCGIILVAAVTSFFTSQYDRMKGIKSEEGLPLWLIPKQGHPRHRQDL